MLLTLVSNESPVYINPEIVAFITAIEEENPDTRETIRFTRVYTKDLKFPDGVMPWIDVKDDVVEIYRKLSKKK